MTQPGNKPLLGLAVALLAVAVFPPLADWSEHRSFAAHMAQHLLIGDLAPLLLVVGLGALAVRPALAVPLWAASLALWHVPVVYEAALHHETVHLLQHAALFAAGVLLWSAVVSPRSGLGGRLAAVGAMMATGLVLASVLIWWPRVLYSTYAQAHTLGGIAPLTDQRLGGGLMLLEGALVGFGAAAWLVLQLFREDAVADRARRLETAQPANEPMS